MEKARAWCDKSCEIILPRFGLTYVHTKVDFCKRPPHFYVRLLSDGLNSRLTFVAGRGVEIRQIGNEYWPMRLNVHFKQIQLANRRNRYHIKACIHTVSTGDITCFMNNTFQNDKCNINASNTPLALLSLFLATFFVLITVGALYAVHRLYFKQNGKKFVMSRKSSSISSSGAFSKHCIYNSIPSSLTVSPPAREAEQLSVIQEVDEKEDTTTISLHRADSVTDEAAVRLGSLENSGGCEAP